MRQGAGRIRGDAADEPVLPVDEDELGIVRLEGGARLRHLDVVGARHRGDVRAAAGQSDEAGTVGTQVRLEHGRRVERRIEADECDREPPAQLGMLVERSRERMQFERTTIAAARVAERDEHRAAAQIRERERAPVLIDEREIGRRCGDRFAARMREQRRGRERRAERDPEREGRERFQVAAPNATRVVLIGRFTTAAKSPAAAVSHHIAVYEPVAAYARPPSSAPANEPS